MVAVTDVVEGEYPPESVLTQLFDLTDLDRRVYLELVGRSSPADIDAIADAVDRERTTVYRSVERLRGQGVVTRRSESIPHGGARYLFSARDPDEVGRELLCRLNELYATLMPLTREFERRYGDGT
ncbi:MAG: helix-turn-helix domain-containing protein [Salinigranum sp.]